MIGYGLLTYVDNIIVIATLTHVHLPPTKQPPKTRAKSVPLRARRIRTYSGYAGGGGGGGGDRDSGGEDDFGDWRCSVFVSHIPLASTKEEIGGIFCRFGTVDKVRPETFIG